jgi:hypothetical protein
MNSELEEIWKEVVMVELKVLFGRFLEGLKKTTKGLN